MRDGKGIAISYEPQEWVIILCLLSVLVALLFALHKRRQKPT